MTINSEQRLMPSLLTTESSESSKLRRRFSASAAAALLGLSITVNANAQSQRPILVASASETLPTSPNASVEQRGRQMVTLKDGRQMSFAEIARLQGAKKDAILEGMNRVDRIHFKEWDLQAANQGLQAANQANEGKRQLVQAANQEGQNLDRQLIDRYTQYVANIERGANGERKILQDIVNADFTPEALKERARTLLRRTDITLAGN